MKEREINILETVEGDVAEKTTNKAFGELDENEKMRIINHLHSKWTDPDNQVRNRIKLFAVRSPEILKPILES